ncbi:adenylate cyclase type 10-like isoform X2 [Meleagris gallopavo]|uniref:adenylate cyclase type 10-like isoform X2 n=1 Tax=Meleagris gallopavo TaxID=9103 RepID=UPI00093D10AE|nr:adenylate cyclase type 10-like isoform X2 [Meleagris gallopavo]
MTSLPADCDVTAAEGQPTVTAGLGSLCRLSGFTALAEKCVQQNGPERGAEELAHALNTYMGDILEVVLDFGGDILKFAGDAVLVLWRAAQPHLPTAINLALQCSSEIQKKYGTHDTHMGLMLHLKIGISAGIFSFISVRGGDRQYFFICNQALDEVIEAQNLSAAYEIVLSQTCWELCEQQRIRANYIAGRRAVKVVEMRHLTRQEYRDAVDQLNMYRGDWHLEGMALQRPVLRSSAGPEVGARLEKHISTAVLQKLYQNVPLELCSELRPVTCLFVQLQFADKISTVELSSSLSNSSSMISEIISPHKGEINKSLLFDKGCTFLCVFGFPGEKLACESTHALECAMQILCMASTELGKLQQVSVGVSSGTVFCGLTGHPERFEHTVLGFKVNLAARMMMAYPGMVSCDAETYAASRLPSYCFKELPQRDMKGVTNPVTIYQYMGITKQ